MSQVKKNICKPWSSSMVFKAQRKQRILCWEFILYPLSSLIVSFSQEPLGGQQCSWLSDISHSRVSHSRVQGTQFAWIPWKLIQKFPVVFRTSIRWFRHGPRILDTVKLANSETFFPFSVIRLGDGHIKRWVIFIALISCIAQRDGKPYERGLT